MCEYLLHVVLQLGGNGYVQQQHEFFKSGRCAVESGKSAQQQIFDFETVVPLHPPHTGHVHRDSSSSSSNSSGRGGGHPIPYLLPRAVGHSSLLL